MDLKAIRMSRGVSQKVVSDALGCSTRQQPKSLPPFSFYYSRNRDSTASDTITSSTITAINTHLVGVIVMIPPLRVDSSHYAADRFFVRYHPLWYVYGHQTFGIDVNGNVITTFHGCTSLAVQYPPYGNWGGDCEPSSWRYGTAVPMRGLAHPSG